METNESNTLMDKVAEALRKAATELDELRVQAHLGKAEAAEKYEEWKKKFDHFMHDARAKFGPDKETTDHIQDEIKGLFDQLRVQLALGKAETLEAFREQKKKILAKINEIQAKIKANPTLNKMYAVVLVEIEKFKVFLEWLEQKLSEGKDFASEKFNQGKSELNDFVDKIKDKFKEADAGRWANFQEEMSEAFTHMKQAFAKP